MSMTKNFTGVAVMMLVEDGRIELRRPISDYLPEFKEAALDGQPPKEPIKVWHLMSHTSGLGGDPEGDLQDNPRTLRVGLTEAYAITPTSRSSSSRARNGSIAIWALPRWGV
jgi:CubicO group peptidase (beta-lactamase class C family)